MNIVRQNIKKECGAKNASRFSTSRRRRRGGDEKFRRAADNRDRFVLWRERIMANARIETRTWATRLSVGAGRRDLFHTRQQLPDDRSLARCWLARRAALSFATRTHTHTASAANKPSVVAPKLLSASQACNIHRTRCAIQPTPTPLFSPGVAYIIYM